MKNILFLICLILFVFPDKTAFAQKGKDNPFKRGGGVIEYNEYAPLSDKPISLFYYIPSRGNIKKMKVLFSMHGAERSGLVQRGVWRNLAEEHGFIILAPQFVHKNGYLENDYQFGGVSETAKEFVLKPEEKWTYQMIENLFDYFKECTGSTAETYDMFGHSAGGQFVHRYLLMMPNARVGIAVAGNPGNYTYPVAEDLVSPNGLSADPSGWPFSFKNTPFATDERLRAFFKRNLVILVGTKDTELMKEGTPENAVALLQGKHRHERGWNYFIMGQNIARAKGFEFNWKIQDVPEAGHSSAHLVYGQPDVRNWRIDGGERVYNNKDLTNKGAYKIIFEP